MALVLFGVACIVFFIAHVIPADPVGAILGGNAPPEKIDQLRAQLGYDRPLIVQFGSFLKGAVVGDFGISIKTNNPVMVDIGLYFPATIELALVAIIISVFLGVLLGILSAVYRNKTIDNFSRIFSILGVSMPVFWIGLILILIFYFRLDWLPGGGRLNFFLDPPKRITGMYLFDSFFTGNWEVFKDSLIHILLPAFVLGYNSTASIARITRSSMLEVLSQEYIRTAKAKGLKKRLVIYRHALRNALIPTVTIIGLVFGGLLEGAVLTETVFSWPGLGRYITSGLLSLDYPAVMGGTIYIAFIYSLANLAVDILYAFLDPRMRV
jgi:peptide/nickel transport system permease protein